MKGQEKVFIFPLCLRMTGLEVFKELKMFFIKAIVFFWEKHEKLDWLDSTAFLFAWNQTKNVNGPVRPSSCKV